MRRNASTVVVLPGPAPAEVLSAVGRSMNVALIQPNDPVDDDGDGLAAAAGALQQAGRSTSAYALVPADPLAAVAGAFWGGLLAWTIGVYHPKVVQRLVAVSAPHPLRLTAFASGSMSQRSS